jgi:hypothetical protein
MGEMESVSQGKVPEVSKVSKVPEVGSSENL